MDSSSVLKAIPESALPYPLLRGDAGGRDHSHSTLPADSFEVRGPNYIVDKKKMPSDGPLFDLMHVDMLRSESKLGNLAARGDSWLRRAREVGDTRYYLVVTYVTTSSPYIHLIIYFAVRPESFSTHPRFEGLWKRFTEEGAAGDTFRNERWKVIPRIQEGAWIVKTAVGTVPALLGTKLAHTWIICNDGGSNNKGAGVAVGGGAAPNVNAFKGPGPYLETDCDVSSSTAAGILVSMLQGYAK